MIIIPEEWISEPDENGNGFLEGWMLSGDEEYPVPVETHHVKIEDVKLGEEQDFEFILECAQTPEVYPDEAAYKNGNEQTGLAAESVIPAGLFSPKEDKDFIPAPRIILSGRVTETFEDPLQYGFREGDILFLLSCLGNEFSVVLNAEIADGLKIKKGNIVSGVFWVQGWPSEDTDN